jgi:Protein kinase domain
MPNYYLQDGTEVLLNNTAIGEGAEGEVYEVLMPLNLKAKLFKLIKEDKRKKKEAQIRYMVNNCPVLKAPQTIKNSFIWPEEIILENGNFCGYIMPKANGILLESLCEFKLGFYPQPRHTEKLGKEWSYLDRKNKNSLQHRLRLCSTIAKTLVEVHKSDIYVVGDMKPINIIIQSFESISFIDVDSFQIKEGDNVIFESMNTDEYTPPNDSGKVKSKEWDYFGVAIIFYQILCGLYPFGSVKCLPPYNNNDINSNSDFLKEGIFPFGKKSVFCVDEKQWHIRFKELTTEVQELFIRCFDDGLNNPQKRPTADEWINSLTPLPEILNFKSSRDIVFPNLEFNLLWGTKNAKEVKIVGYGKVGSSGKLTVKISKDTVYILKVSNEFGEIEQPYNVRCKDISFSKNLAVPKLGFNIGFNENLVKYKSSRIDTKFIIALNKFLFVSVNKNFIVHLSKDVVIKKPLFDFYKNMHKVKDVFDRIKKLVN